MLKKYIGILLISIAALALEISLIRIFSIAQWYHFAFMAVSIALFGIAASGTFLSIKRFNVSLENASILFSVSVLLGFFVFNKLSFDPYIALLNYIHLFRLILYYILLGLPFFFFGITIATMFSDYQDKASKIYFFNLLGSAIGTILVLFLIPFFKAKIIVAIVLIGLLAALFFTRNIVKVSILLLIALSIFFIPFDINISKYKELNQALNYPNSELITTRYNSFSRVDVVNSSFVRYAPGLSINFNGTLPEQLGIFVDGSNMNAITKHNNLDFLDYLPNAIAFRLKEAQKTLVINSGAGLDVLLALNNNASVTAVESNPIVVNLLKNEYREFSNDIYNKASVNIDDGRSFVKKDKYDVIILSLAGNILSSSAGLTSLTENYLLTLDAFRDYHNSLNDDGILIVTRWLLYPPRESLRLFSIAKEFDTENIAMFRSLTTVTLILSKSKFDNEKINIIKDFTEKNSFDIIYLPTEFDPNKYAKFKEPYHYNYIKQILSNKDFYDDYLFDVDLVYDDRPFYFNFFKWNKVFELYRAIGEKWQPFFDSGFLLLFLFIQATILSLIFILMPIKYLRNIKIDKKGLAYFFFIGLAFLFIEIVFIQKFILFLGHVVLSTSVVIFSILLFSSLGALISDRFDKKLNYVIIILFLLIIIYSIFLQNLLNSLITLPLEIKLILSVFIIAPLAFFMGMPFPLGIKRISKDLIPWAWAVNGSASVLASILAVLIALSTGYNFVFILSGFLYLASLISFYKK